MDEGKLEMNKLLDFIEHTYCVHDINSPVRKEIEKLIEGGLI